MIVQYMNVSIKISKENVNGIYTNNHVAHALSLFIYLTFIVIHDSSAISMILSRHVYNLYVN